MELRDQAGWLSCTGSLCWKSDTAPVSQRKGSRRQVSLHHARAGCFVPADWVVDGELVALDPSGKPSFSLIQNSATSGAEIVFFAFDLLRHAGKDLTQLPLSERRKLLRLVLKQSTAVQFSDDFALPAQKMLEMVKAHGLEGLLQSAFRAPTSKDAAQGPGSKGALNSLRSS